MTFIIAICDDEPKDIERIHTYLQNFEMQYDIDCEVSQFRNVQKKEIVSIYWNT